MHKKIMQKAAKALSKDVKHYESKEKSDKKRGAVKAAKHDKVEKKEAKSAAKDLKRRVRSAHEY